MQAPSTTTAITDAPVAMVSGASRGLGLAIATELLQAGWRLSLGCRSPAPPQLMQRRDAVDVSAFDARDPATERAWAERTRQRFGRIDAIVHNAGILSTCSPLDASSEAFDTLFEVNVKSPLRLTQQVWPNLLASPQGKVVVIASLAAKRVRSADSTLYAMSKAAVLALAHGLRHCGSDSHVRTTAICPGFVATDMAASVDPALHAELTQPEDVARIVRMVLELPPTASVAEVPVSWRVESQF